MHAAPCPWVLACHKLNGLPIAHAPQLNVCSSTFVVSRVCSISVNLEIQYADIVESNSSHKRGDICANGDKKRRAGIVSRIVSCRDLLVVSSKVDRVGQGDGGIGAELNNCAWAASREGAVYYSLITGGDTLGEDKSR